MCAGAGTPTFCSLFRLPFRRSLCGVSDPHTLLTLHMRHSLHRQDLILPLAQFQQGQEALCVLVCGCGSPPGEGTGRGKGEESPGLLRVGRVLLSLAHCSKIREIKHIF